MHLATIALALVLMVAVEHPVSAQGPHLAPGAPAVPEPTGNPNETKRPDLTTPEVRESLAPESDAQGNRPGDDGSSSEGTDGLYAALAAVRRAPPDLYGRPMPRPNPLASEPAKEMEPLAGLESLFPDDYVE